MCSVWVWSSCQIYDSYREHMVESYSTLVCWCVIYRFGHVISCQIYDSYREHMVESYSTVVCWCVIYRFGHVISFQIYDSYREHMVESYSTVVCWCVIYRFGHVISFQIYGSHRISCEFLIPKPVYLFTCWNVFVIRTRQLDKVVSCMIWMFVFVAFCAIVPLK
jgi:hypothetical protein